MVPRISPWSLVLAGIALALSHPARAQLASKSPFMPPQSAATGPTAAAPLQFVGYMDTRDGRVYRIHDPAKKTSAWVKLNEKNGDMDVVVKQHDESQKPATLTIEHHGKTLDGRSLLVHVGRGLVGEKRHTVSRGLRALTPARRVSCLAGPVDARALEQGTPGGGIVGRVGGSSTGGLEGFSSNGDVSSISVMTLVSPVSYIPWPTHCCASRSITCSFCPTTLSTLCSCA
jgi:hypothetical protein